LQDGREEVDDLKCCLRDGRKDVVKIHLDLGGREIVRKGKKAEAAENWKVFFEIGFTVYELSFRLIVIIVEKTEGKK
jgi:hypothetical protein